jgi:CHAD domain-containing protein
VPTLPDDPRAGDLVRFAVARSTQRLLDHDPIAREGVDPEGVHQARVATRRLRSDLRVLAPLLDEGWVAAVVGDLRWLGGALGDVRDADVLLLRLRGRLDTLDAADWPAGLGLVETLKAARADAVAALAEVMGSARYVALLDVLVAAADAPPTTDGARRRAGKALPPLVAAPVARLDRLAAAVLERGPSATDEELHRVRIAAKRARYAAEVAAPVVGRPAQRMADRLAALQGVLGDHHDACVARAWLRAAATGASAEVALVAGQLMEVERAEASRLRARWPRVWSAASRGKDRAWLT